MKKEVVQRDVVALKTVYIADDGSKFSTEWDCREYEFGHNLSEAMKKVQHCDALEGVMNFDGTEHSEGSEYYWFHPNNSNDVEILKKTFGKKIIDDRQIGLWVCIERSYNDAWASTLNEGVAQARYVLDALGFHMNIDV